MTGQQAFQQSRQRRLDIPACLENELYTSMTTHSVTAIDGAPLAELTLTPLVKTHEIFRNVEKTFSRMQRMPGSQILSSLRNVGALLRGKEWNFSRISRMEYVSLVSATTGLPLDLVHREIEEIATILDNMEEIVRVQLPASIDNSLDAHEYATPGSKIGYYPAGKNVLIVIPGNIPTICLYWLIPLALKTPVILVPPFEDPFTHFVLIEAIRAVDAALSSCVHFVPSLQGVWTSMLDRVDRVILSESLRQHVSRSLDRSSKSHLIHYGRTKLLIDGRWDDSSVAIALRRMTWNCGRTCTGLTSVIVRQNALEFCQRLAVMISSVVAADFEGNIKNLAQFRVEHAQRIHETIESLTRNGEAEDVTQQIRGSSRMLAEGGRAMLLPTVLLIKDKKSKAFGLELPFPFISVIEAEDEDDLIRLARNTLILSVITENQGLAQRLCLESSILKVFGGAHIERGYHYLDPHEGYLADFLYQKKAVSF